MIPATWYIDLIIHPNYQGKGLGSLLVKEGQKNSKVQLAVCNEAALRVYKKLNWKINLSNKRLARPINPLKWIPFLKELDLSQIIIDDKETNLDRKYFINSPFRKIKHKLVYDIITARLEEFFEVIYKKNINLSHFRKNNKTLYVSIENHDLFPNIKSILQKKLSNKINFFLNEPFEDSLTQASLGAAVLYAKGWEKEAIPVIQPKKSIISRLFSSLFN